MRFLAHDDLVKRGIPGSKVTRWRKERDGRHPRRTRFGDRAYGYAEPVIEVYMRALATGASEKVATMMAESYRETLVQIELSATD